MGNFYSLAHRQLPRVEQEGLFLEFLVQSLGSKVHIFFLKGASLDTSTCKHVEDFGMGK